MAKRKAARSVRKRSPSLRKRLTTITTTSTLLSLFLSGVAVRFLLAIILKRNPTITPDEALYVNIAKSLISQGEILFRGQPARYAYLLYPFLLTPLYALLPLGTDFLQAVQLLNSCLICSIVFPVYYAAKEITGRHDRSLLIAIIALLLPDMAMSTFIMSECLIYALYFTCFYCIVLAVKRGGVRYYVLVGVLGALMYYTKNFHVLLAVVFLLLMLAVNLFGKKYREAMYSLLGGAVLFALCSGLMALSKYVFGLVAPTYNINTAGDVLRGVGRMFSELGIYAEGFVMYAAFFTVALGGAFFAMAAFSLRSYSRDNRLIALITGGSLAAVLVTVLYVIHPATRVSAFTARVELRYLSMYFLPLIALSFAVELDGKRLNIFGAAWLCLTAIYAVVPGLGTGFAKATANVDNHALAMFAPVLVGDTACRVLSILCAAILLLLAFYLFKKGWTTRVRRAAVIVLMALYIASNVAAYDINTVRNSPSLSYDSLEAAKEIDKAGGEAVFVTWYEHSVENLAVDIRAKEILGNTEYNELAHNLHHTNGVYVPYVPAAMRLTSPDRPLSDATLLAFDGGCAYFFQFAPGVAVKETRYGMYKLATIERGLPAFTSVFEGIANDDVIPAREKQAAIHVFDKATRNASGQIVIAMRVNASHGGVIHFVTDAGSASVELNEGANTVRVAVDAGELFPQSVLVYSDTRGVVLRGYEVLYE